MANDAGKKLNELVKKKRKPGCAECSECAGSCARGERERKFGTESENQYDRPVARVLPIPPPFVAPNYDAMYKRMTTLPNRFRAVDQALSDAQAQLDYYNDLQNKYNMTRLRGGLAASQTAVADMMSRRVDAVARANMATKFKLADLQTAYAVVTSAAGVKTPPKPAGTKRPIIDDMVDLYGVPADQLKALLDVSPGGAIDPAALVPYFPTPPPPPTPPTPAPKPQPGP